MSELQKKQLADLCDVWVIEINDKMDSNSYAWREKDIFINRIHDILEL